ncbi:hypothetical protein [Rhizobium sp. Root483D2]|uniref:hypothetical protein n=1 Tax=Rhizobium sp. Root483D2 TaxID=1736545 RepID=UPI000712EA9F|nr:hypothetical protein [Rhizobium sp. Root483D2]KQY20786.1 hypothetical protein ASD32_05060 [Rhizobium sp. Root483D2]
MKIAPDTSDEKPADFMPAQAIDPLQSLCDALVSGADEDKSAARQLISAMERPWEQLPSRLKTAARVDASALLATSGGLAQLISAGYGARTAEQLMRDLGRRG